MVRENGNNKGNNVEDDLWDDAEEFERDQLVEDHEDEDDDDLPSDGHEDWRDDCGIEDADIYGDPECW